MSENAGRGGGGRGHGGSGGYRASGGSGGSGGRDGGRDGGRGGSRGGRGRDDDRRIGGRERSASRVRGDQNRSRQAPSQRSRYSDPARLAAFDLMREVADGAYANIALPRILREERLRGRDAAFATELAYGTIRWQGLYDAILAACADRPIDRIERPLHDTVRLGLHQLFGMRVPPHAAVAETVALARQVLGAGPGGFVNALLRAADQRSREEWVEHLTSGIEDPVKAMALRQSHPEWVVRAMRAAVIGHERCTPEQANDAVESWLAADNTPAAVALVARPGLSTVQELAEHGATPSETVPTAAVLDEGDPGRIDAVRDGRAAVQDEGSQLLTLALAAAPVTGKAIEQERWLDMCAGPGGKAGLLGAIAVERRVPFVANEISEHRAQLVRQSLRSLTQLAHREEVSVEVRESDGRQFGSREPQGYSRVLIDAPCSGLGALRRRPEARWRRTQQDVSQLATLQRELLVSGIEATMSGGLVAYATCSPHLSETRFAVEDVLRKRDDVEIVDARPFFVDTAGEQLPELGPGPFVQLWPDVHGTDAMFLALLRRR